MTTYLKFKEVANLINRSGVTEIQLNPEKQEKDNWELFPGVNKVPGFEYPFHILYLYADCNRKSVQSAAEVIKNNNPDKTLVVYAPSLDEHLTLHHKLFKDKVAGFMTTKDYLLSYIKKQLDNYLSRIKGRRPEDWVDPPIRVPAGFKKKIPNPVYGFLTEIDYGSGHFGGSLSILLGEPGQGKTYMSRYLASRLPMRDLIPIYINSQQWYDMEADDLTSLWKTITQSFRYFETSIGWIDGYEEEFLRVALKVGIFRIIFDGFDEYILWNRGKIGAMDAVRNLSQLAQSTGSRILITSRTSFWYFEVEQESTEDEPFENWVYNILPFDINHAKNYFKKRFPKDSGRQNRAFGIYDRLRKQSKLEDKGNFVGRGFVLHLIADLVTRTDVTPQIAKGIATITQWVMHALCERETVRQKLPIKANEQLEILKVFAEETSRGEKPNTELLETVISLCCKRLEVSQIKALVEKSQSGLGSLLDHPLIRKDPDRDVWEFVQEQIAFYLLGDRIIEYAHESKKSPQNLRDFVNAVQLEGTLCIDIATAIVDQLCYTLKPDSARTKIHEIVIALVECNTPLAPKEADRPGTYLATTIAMLAVNRLCPVGRERTERALEYISYFPSSSLHGLKFFGTITSMDFRGVTFKDCLFDQVTWKNCKFDKKSVFDNCHFIGGRVLSDDSLGLAKWKEGWQDLDAEAMINAIRVALGKKEYNKDDLRRDIGHLIRKFMPKEGTFKSVARSHLERGMVSHSSHRDEIVRVMRHHVVTERRVPGTSQKAYILREEAKRAVEHYTSNGVLSGALAEVYEELCDKLRL